LDAKLLLLLLPFSVFYIIALYYINRYAARVSTEMADTLQESSSRFGQLVNKVLNKKLAPKTKEFDQEYNESLYMHQAELKYKRRFAEIHVDWLNTLFLVVGIAIIIVYIVYIQAAEKIDWQRLLFFLIALRYAASSLQQISATTVAFSRFLPEIQLVYRLLNVRDLTVDSQKLVLNHHSLIFISSNRIDDFEIQQLSNTLIFEKNHSIQLIQDIREQVFKKYFNQLADQKFKVVIVENNLEHLKRIIGNHKEKILPVISTVVIFSCNLAEIKQLTLDEFQNHTQKNDCIDAEEDIDAFM
jgi:ABC-type multidrug transport system fused ATPase/permease subunit